jgi:hypothetical protein
MATIKSYSDLQQSRKLAEFLPIESADMVLSFRHTKNDEYIPEYVVSRNYVEVYNEMMKLPGMEKRDVCQLIQPVWSLAALLDVIPWGQVNRMTNSNKWEASSWKNSNLVPKYYVEGFDNPTDACYELILKLHELKLL